MEGKSKMNPKVSLFLFVFACTVFTLGAFDNYRDASRAAQKARQSGNFDEAVKFYEEAATLAKNPSQMCNVLNAAADVLCWNQNNLEGALKKMDEILQSEKTNDDQKVQALTRKGTYCRWRRRPDEATSYFEKAMEMKSSKNTRHYLLNIYSEFLISQKKYSQAKTLLQEASSIEKPSDGNIVITKTHFAKLAAAEGNFEDAIKLYREALAFPKIPQWLIPNIYREMVNKGYIPQKNFQGANQVIEEVEKNDAIPEKNKKWINEVKASVLLGQARLAVEQNALEDAERFYKTAAVLPKVSSGLLGVIYRELINRVYKPQKRTEEALKALDEAGNRAEITSKIWINDMRANIAYLDPVRELIHEKKFEEASAKLQSMPTDGISKGTKLTYSNLSAEIELGQGRLFFSRNQYDEALESFRKALLIENTSVHIQRNANAECARTLMQQKKLDEAKAYIDTFLNLPNLSATQKLQNNLVLADYYIACQQVEDAIEVLKKGLSVKGGKPHPDVIAQNYEKLAAIYLLQKKDLDKAEEYHKAAYAIPTVSWGLNKWLDKQIKLAREKQQKN